LSWSITLHPAGANARQKLFPNGVITTGSSDAGPLGATGPALQLCVVNKSNDDAAAANQIFLCMTILPDAMRG
jgi:hypothetical protein